MAPDATPPRTLILDRVSFIKPATFATIAAAIEHSLSVVEGNANGALDHAEAARAMAVNNHDDSAETHRCEALDHISKAKAELAALSVMLEHLAGLLGRPA